MKKWIRLLLNAETILYLIFGVLTTILNLVIFSLLYDYQGMPWLPATSIAWIAGVLFAFITNKLFVFRSKSFDTKLLLREAVGFLAARLVTLGVDIAGLWLLLTVLRIGGEIATLPIAVGGLSFTLLLTWETVCKAIVNVAVIVLNYIFSKLFIFTGAKESEAEKG